MRFFENKWPAIFLWPISLFYLLVVSIRNFLYAQNIFKTYSVSCLVISVGNITVGGSGKTPTVQYLANRFMKKGKTVCIISRGYKRNTKEPVIVSTGKQILCRVEEAGDEPFMLAKNAYGASVIVDVDRVRGARTAMKNFSPDIIILDDGFQHRKIHRDIDIITIDGDSQFGNGFLLPAGPLREPKTQLSRADLFWIYGEPFDIFFLRKWDQIERIEATIRPARVENAHGQFLQPNLSQSKVVAFAGLGNPMKFKKSLLQLGAEVLRFITFADHHSYTTSDVNQIENIFMNSGADSIITTEKDWVKICSNHQLDSYWTFLKIESHVVENQQGNLIFDRFFRKTRIN